MIIGILSDTHGDIVRTAQAVKRFIDVGVGAVFHCGDVGSSAVLAELAGLDVPVYVVFGNVDLYTDEFRFFPSNLGIHLLGRFGEVELDGYSIALLHSDDQFKYQKAVRSGKYDYVFSGHSHVVHHFTEDKTCCINPGAVGRGGEGRAALLDLASNKLTVFSLGR